MPNSNKLEKKAKVFIPNKSIHYGRTNINCHKLMDLILTALNYSQMVKEDLKTLEMESIF